MMFPSLDRQMQCTGGGKTPAQLGFSSGLSWNVVEWGRNDVSSMSLLFFPLCDGVAEKQASLYCLCGIISL